MGNLAVKRATLEDSSDIWVWRNDGHTKKMSASSEDVSWTTHKAWFEKVSLDRSTSVYVGHLKSNSSKVGVCRFDVREDLNVAIVSLNLNPEMRGLGLSAELLRESIVQFHSYQPIDLSATIRRSNVKSINCFLKCGFSYVSGDETFNYYRFSASP